MLPRLQDVGLSKHNILFQKSSSAERANIQTSQGVLRSFKWRFRSFADGLTADFRHVCTASFCEVQNGQREYDSEAIVYKARVTRSSFVQSCSKGLLIVCTPISSSYSQIHARGCKHQVRWIVWKWQERNKQSDQGRGEGCEKHRSILYREAK